MEFLIFGAVCDVIATLPSRFLLAPALECLTGAHCSNLSCVCCPEDGNDARQFPDSAPNTTKFKHVSVGRKEVWAVTDGGCVLRRQGISEENPAGCSWDIGIPVGTVFGGEVSFINY